LRQRIVTVYEEHRQARELKEPGSGGLPLAEVLKESDRAFED
jgi:hypothetical protein